MESEEKKELLLAYVEIREGKLHPASLEVLSETARFAAKSGNNTAALLFAKEADRELTAEIASCGINMAYIIRSDAYADHDRSSWVKAFSFLVAELRPWMLLFAHTQQAMEFWPAVAVRLGLPIITGTTFFRTEGRGLQITTTVFERQASSILRWDGTGSLLVSLLPRVFEKTRLDSPGPMEVVEITPPAPDAASENQITVEDVRPDDLHSMDLEDADIIVSGGGGMGSAEGFILLEELAQELGGVIGGTRIAVDKHWLARDRMVGQTGKTVSPELYIACGISGATQHVMGIKASRHVLAINTDREAPIFKAATAGAVGDVFKVLPELTMKIREEKKKAARKE